MAVRALAHDAVHGHGSGRLNDDHPVENQVPKAEGSPEARSICRGHGLICHAAPLFEDWGDEFHTRPLRGEARLEVKLHGELDEAWVARTLPSAEVRRPQLHRNGLDLAGRTDRSPQTVHMVPDIEEVSPKLKAHLLANREGLQQSHVPGLVSGTMNDVSLFISKRARG